MINWAHIHAKPSAIVVAESAEIARQLCERDIAAVGPFTEALPINWQGRRVLVLQQDRPALEADAAARYIRQQRAAEVVVASPSRYGDEISPTSVLAMMTHPLRNTTSDALFDFAAWMAAEGWELHPKGRAYIKPLFASYAGWCERHGLHQTGSNHFSINLRKTYPQLKLGHTENRARLDGIRRVPIL